MPGTTPFINSAASLARTSFKTAVRGGRALENRTLSRLTSISTFKPLRDDATCRGGGLLGGSGAGGGKV